MELLLGIGICGTDWICCRGRNWSSEGAWSSFSIQESLVSALSDMLCEATRGIGGSTGGLAETGDSWGLLG